MASVLKSFFSLVKSTNGKICACHVHLASATLEKSSIISQQHFNSKPFIIDEAIYIIYFRLVFWRIITLLSKNYWTSNCIIFNMCMHNTIFYSNYKPRVTAPNQLITRKTSCDTFFIWVRIKISQYCQCLIFPRDM